MDFNRCVFLLSVTPHHHTACPYLTTTRSTSPRCTLCKERFHSLHLQVARAELTGWVHFPSAPSLRFVCKFRGSVQENTPFRGVHLPDGAGPSSGLCPRSMDSEAAWLGRWAHSGTPAILPCRRPGLWSCPDTFCPTRLRSGEADPRWLCSGGGREAAAPSLRPTAARSWPLSRALPTPEVIGHAACQETLGSVEAALPKPLRHFQRAFNGEPRGRAGEALRACPRCEHRL